MSAVQQVLFGGWRRSTTINASTWAGINPAGAIVTGQVEALSSGQALVLTGGSPNSPRASTLTVSGSSVSTNYAVGQYSTPQSDLALMRKIDSASALGVFRMNTGSSP